MTFDEKNLPQMSERRKAVVRKERDLVTYAELWHTANILIATGEERPDGRIHQFRAALIFQAFTFEAALNHIGAKLFKCWDSIERTLNPERKLALVAEKLGVEPKFGDEPWQTIRELLRYRNALAHGKTEIIKEEYEEEVREYMDEKFYEFAKSNWEKFGTEENARRAKKAIVDVVRDFYNRAKMDDGDLPFAMGQQLGTSSLKNGVESGRREILTPAPHITGHTDP